MATMAMRARMRAYSAKALAAFIVRPGGRPVHGPCAGAMTTARGRPPHAPQRSEGCPSVVLRSGRTDLDPALRLESRLPNGQVASAVLPAGPGSDDGCPGLCRCQGWGESLVSPAPSIFFGWSLMR